MMRTALKLASTALAGLALTATAAVPAQAATAWEHAGYTGSNISGDVRANVGSLNDRISSWERV